jgi:AcrR family transcriptional regulator
MARLTRSQRRDKTRAELVVAARRVFLRDGFHAASLDEIADEAGYSKGAVYSNFDGKDDLFLAVLDAQYEGILRTHGALMREAGTLEDALQAAGKQLAKRARQDPNWTPLLDEFWTHASRLPELRREVAKRHEQQLDGVASILTEIADECGVEFVVPAREAARRGTALGRGLALERLLDPNSHADEMFEDLFSAMILGFTRPKGVR